MTCSLNFGIGIRNGIIPKYLKATLTMWCRLLLIQRTTTSLPAHRLITRSKCGNWVRKHPTSPWKDMTKVICVLPHSPGCWASRWRCRRSWVPFSGLSNRTQSRQWLTTAAMFLRSCVDQTLSRVDGSRHSLHTLAQYREYNKDLIAFLSSKNGTSKFAWSSGRYKYHYLASCTMTTFR